eukprot:6198615-Pleurochrysis_carterae.AAC.3
MAWRLPTDTRAELASQLVDALDQYRLQLLVHAGARCLHVLVAVDPTGCIRRPEWHMCMGNARYVGVVA